MDKLQLLMDKSETAKKILIRANIRLIFHIAKTYRNKGIPYSDLVQEGTFGLLKAVERYDPDRGFRFSTYSSWWIRQAISRAVAEKSRVVRMPVHIHELLMNVNRVEKQFLAAKSRKPTDVELAELVGISVEKLLGLSEYTKDVGSTEDILFQNNAKGTSSQASVKDTVTSALSSMPKHIAEELTKISDIESVMVDLTEREAEVISMRYGIGGRIFTLEEAGIKLDVTRERIRQIENRAMVKIRPTKEDAMFSSNPTDITEEDMF